MEPPRKHTRHSQLALRLWTCAELLPKLPLVLKLRQIFNLFANHKNDKNSDIDINDISECLLAMGKQFDESQLQSIIKRILDQFPQSNQNPAGRVNFEFVMTVYSRLACLKDMPSTEALIQGLSYCDTDGTGVLPYAQLRNILTNVGERLNESEVSDLLDNMKDSDGNVNYINLVQNMFFSDNDAEAKLKQVRLYLSVVGTSACNMNMHKRDQFIQSLRKLDTNNTGHLPIKRLLKLLNSSGDKFTRNELTTLIRGITNTKGQVDYTKFLRIVMNEKEFKMTTIN